MNPEFIPPRSGSLDRTDHDRIIIGCAIGQHYRATLRSTINHCEVHCPEAWKLWYDDLPDGCPSHRESQYAFKIHAMQRAISAGFRHILWMDTAFQPVAPIEAVWQKIANFGWHVVDQGDKLGRWATDRALELYPMARNAAMEVPLVYSGIVGLDVRSPAGRAIWTAWRSLCEVGAFIGPHFNVPGQEEWQEVGSKWKAHCSYDPRCVGHRHDEAALSFVLHALGYKPDLGWLTIQHGEHGLIGHCVPDYDVVAMRGELLAFAEEYGHTERIRGLCR